MSISAAQENLFTGGYSLLRRSGALRTSVGCRLFRSAYFFYKRHIEDDLHHLIRSHPGLLNGGNVLDIGANIGYTATVLARAIEAGRNVYAFEPEPFNYGTLQRVAADPRLKGRIIALQCAVGAETGTVDLWLNDRHHADHRVITEQFRSASKGISGVSVPLVSIDRFLERNPGPVSLVKIDVQGYELAVCQGMKDTIQKNPNLTIVLEYMPTAMNQLGFNPSDLLRFLADRDFRTYCIRPNGKLLTGVPSAIGDSTYADLLFSRSPLECGGAA